MFKFRHVLGKFTETKDRQQELEMSRKNVVVAFFDTIHNDVVREIDTRVQTDQF